MHALDACRPRVYSQRRRPMMTDAGAEPLERSRDQVLTAARHGRHGAAVLAHAAAGRVVAGWTLDPAPRDPAAHVAQTHVRGREHLRRLLHHAAAGEVRSPMTGQLFDRLTRPTEAARRAIDYT